MSPDAEVEVNRADSAGRTLLTYSVEAGDEAAELTRLLLNHGAHVWPSEAVNARIGGDVVERVAVERTRSGFPWYLRSVMSRGAVAGTEETRRLLCHEMAADPQRMKRHVQRMMMMLGRGAVVNGPLFAQVRMAMMPDWKRPASLRFICVSKIRRQMGPKRLSDGKSAAQLKLPAKLERFVRLEQSP